MLELLAGGRSRQPPGNTNLVNFYQDPNNSSRKAGFFGEVAYTDFPVLNNLYTLGNVPTANRLRGGTIPWLKFYLDGKILLVPKKTIAYGVYVNWQSLYNNGLVYGVTGSGGRPVGGGVPQYKTFQYQGLTYLVRLFKRLNGVDPLPYTGNYANRTEFVGSEFQRLYPNIYKAANIFGQQGGKWAGYDPSADLGFGDTTGTGTIAFSAEGINANDSVTRSGSIGTDISQIGAPSIGDTGQYIGWLPVLEWIK